MLTDTEIRDLILRTAARMKAEILQDIADGVVPADVGSFSELHDHVDANCYGGLCDDDCPPELIPWHYNGDESDEAREANPAIDRVNVIFDIVDGWLKLGRPADTEPLPAL